MSPGGDTLVIVPPGWGEKIYSKINSRLVLLAKKILFLMTQKLSPNNRLSKYIKINPKDRFLAEYVDYVWFYFSRDSDFFWKLDSRLRKSDNGNDSQIWLLNINKEKNRYFISVSYLWFPVRVARVLRTKILWQNVAKVDFYWKWILAINSMNLRGTFLSVFSSMWANKITLTRIDYAVDCQKMNFRKTNSLKNKISWKITWLSWVEYICFGRRWKSAHFIRYYDKLKELNKHWTLALYPQYRFLDSVMRYELQINSEWLDEDERIIKLYDLESLCNFWLTISQRSSLYHLWGKTIQETLDIQSIKTILNKNKKSWNHNQLSRIYMLVNTFISELQNECKNLPTELQQ